MQQMLVLSHYFIIKVKIFNLNYFNVLLVAAMVTTEHEIPLETLQ